LEEEKIESELEEKHYRQLFISYLSNKTEKNKDEKQDTAIFDLPKILEQYVLYYYLLSFFFM
jgi:zona occludens toxin (predicted ATPase)